MLAGTFVIYGRNAINRYAEKSRLEVPVFIKVLFALTTLAAGSIFSRCEAFSVMAGQA